jgi:sugar fermentation stimulation protein A
MKFKKKLLEGVLLQRYKRFFADIECNGKKITIHVPNTGSMRGVIDKTIKQKCLFSLHGDESKKLKGTLEAIQVDGKTWVGVNTSNPNKIVQEAIEHSLAQAQAYFKHWSDYGFYKSEYKISKETRLDGVFCKVEEDLENPKALKHFIEIKNTTLLEEIEGKRVALFPDSVTERGQKHIKEMLKLMQQGHKAELIFTIQREDAEFFAVASKIDPEYARLLKQAVAMGLRVSPTVVVINAEEVSLTQKTLQMIEL